jgi:hypothetical protein
MSRTPVALIPEAKKLSGKASETANVLGVDRDLVTDSLERLETCGKVRMGEALGARNLTGSSRTITLKVSGFTIL